jgi:hypothetical protein
MWGTNWLRLAGAMIVFGLIAGCASTQLNYNTLDLAESYDSLLSKQIIYNISKTMEDPWSIPAQIKVSGGNTTTTNAITPTLSYPLSASQAVTTTNTLAASLTRASSFGITDTNKGLTVGASDTWTQTWSLDPVNDPDELRRLQVLYRYVTKHLADGVYYEGQPLSDGAVDALFECTYPIIQTTDTSTAVGSGATGAGTGNSNTSTTVTIDPKSGSYTIKNQSVKPPPSPPTAKYVRRTCSIINDTLVSIQYVQVNPDKTFVTPPGCIMCDLGIKVSRTIH